MSISVDNLLNKVIHFRSLEKHNENDFGLWMSRKSTYDEVRKRVARQLGLSDETKIRLTSGICTSDKPQSHPIKYQGEDHFFDILKETGALYYEVFDVPPQELESLKTLNVSFHHARNDKVSIRSVTLPIHSTVGDVIDHLKTKVELSHPNAVLRLIQVFNHFIVQVFPFDKKIVDINARNEELRAEEIPEDEVKNLGPHDRFIHVCHFRKESWRNQMKVQYFGEPFILKINEGETLAEVSVHVQKKLEVPDDEFSKWRFAFLSWAKLSRLSPEYLQDSEIVYSRFQRGEFMSFLGLEHSEDAPETTVYLQDSDIMYSHFQEEEDKVFVRNSENIEGHHPMEVAHEESWSRWENQLIKDPPSSRFTWKIENFSRLKSQKHYSDIFLVSCYRWRLLIYPKGNNGDHLSIYLHAVDESDLPHAQFSLAVVNQIDNRCTMRKGSQHQFTLGDKEGGFKSFIPLRDLIDPSSGYLLNDICIIEAEINVCRPIRKRKREESVQVVASVAEMDPVTVLVRTPDAQIELDGQTEVFIEEDVPELETLVECASPMPHEIAVPSQTAQSREITPLHEHPGAGELFEERQHCHGIYGCKFEEIGGFSVLKTQAFLYKKIWLKYGHIASSQVVTSSYIGQVSLVIEVMNSIMEMYHCYVAEVSSAMINSWEEKIKMADTLKFNIKWLRERFDDVKKDFNRKHNLETTLLERDQSLRLAKARLVTAETQIILAQDEFKMVEETVSALEASISPLISEKQMYVEKGKLLLFDGLL